MDLKNIETKISEKNTFEEIAKFYNLLAGNPKLSEGDKTSLCFFWEEFGISPWVDYAYKPSFKELKETDSKLYEILVETLYSLSKNYNVPFEKD